jgi:hypothetical protein
MVPSLEEEEEVFEDGLMRLDTAIIFQRMQVIFIQILVPT